MKKKRGEEDDDGRPWEAVLPWLPPPDLAAASATCRRLRRLATAISTLRAADASRGYEPRPIPFLSPSPPPYSPFLYTPFSFIGGAPPDPFSRPWPDPSPPPPPPFFGPGGAAGCHCEASACSPETCPCGPLECGPPCRCRRRCPNRRTQGGATVALEIRRTHLKGWGLFAGESIPMGQFICEYAGEYVTTAEARRRQREYDGGGGGAALLVVREHLPSGKACLRVNVDATAAGSAARFVNHECGGGNVAAAVVRSSGLLLPRVCFFAGRDIVEGEELTFSYGEPAGQLTGRPCFCGSPFCCGFLPSEET